MNLEYFIARKVAASGSKSFSRLIIRIAIIAIALSITVMIVATSLIKGFKNEISSKIFGFWGHIHIMDTNVNRSFEAVPIKKDQDFYPYLDTIDQVPYIENFKFLGYENENYRVEKLSNGGVRHIQVFAHKPGIISTKKEFEGILLKGISTDFDWKYLQQYLIEGEKIELNDTIASRDIIISENTSNRLNLKVGKSIKIYFISSSGEQIPRVFKVCGIYKTGLEEYDKKFALVDITMIQDILGWEKDQVGGFEVFLDDIRDLNVLNEHIYLEEIPNNLYSQTIRSKLPSIFEWLELQDINEIVILILMVVVAIINMITALMILILERTNMIGILKALGQTSWSIRKIFIYYAAYIVLMGLFWGNIIGILICFIQDRFGVIKLSEADYYLAVAPIEFNIWTVVLLNIGTLVITLIFLIIPSYLVTKITPVKAIRFK